MFTPLSEDRVYCSDWDVDQLLRHWLSCFRKLPFAQVHTVILIQTDTVLRLSKHFHVSLFLFLDGATCVRPSSVMTSCAHLVPVYCNSLLGTLNVRRAIRGRGHNDLGISLRVIGESGGSSGDNRGVCACAI